MEYLGVDDWEAVLAMFGEDGIYEGQWGWLEVLHTAEVGDNVYFMTDDSIAFEGAFVQMGDNLMFIDQEGDYVNPASLISRTDHTGYTVTRPGAYCDGMVCERLVAEYLDRNREYYHLRIHPGNLHTDPISVWHYAELLGIGAANYALGALMIVEGAALCTSGFGCVAAGMAVAPGLGAFGTGFAFHYGLIVELKHQHVIEWGP